MWIFEGKEVTSLKDLPENSYGIIYRLGFSDGTYYFGKKDLYNRVKLPALKNGKQRDNSSRIGKNIDGKRVYFDIINKESNWLSYEGSSSSLQDLEISSKEILALAVSRRELTYLEAKCLFWESALEDDLCRNENILGKFFKDNLR